MVWMSKIPRSLRQYFSLGWWHCLGEFRRHGLVEVSMSWGQALKVRGSQDTQFTILYLWFNLWVLSFPCQLPFSYSPPRWALFLPGPETQETLPVLVSMVVGFFFHSNRKASDIGAMPLTRWRLQHSCPNQSRHIFKYYNSRMVLVHLVLSWSTFRTSDPLQIPSSGSFSWDSDIRSRSFGF